MFKHNKKDCIKMLVHDKTPGGEHTSYLFHAFVMITMRFRQ